MLLPWAVFAVAAALKFWRLTAVFRRSVLRRHLLDAPTSTERFRQSLERIWQQDQRQPRTP